MKVEWYKIFQQVPLTPFPGTFFNVKNLFPAVKLFLRLSLLKQLPSCFIAFLSLLWEQLYEETDCLNHHLLSCKERWWKNWQQAPCSPWGQFHGDFHGDFYSLTKSFTLSLPWIWLNVGNLQLHGQEQLAALFVNCFGRVVVHGPMDGHAHW